MSTWNCEQTIHERAEYQLESVTQNRTRKEVDAVLLERVLEQAERGPHRVGHLLNAAHGDDFQSLLYKICTEYVKHSIVRDLIGEPWWPSRKITSRTG